MSRLRHADYTEHLKGKTIARVRWFNDAEHRSLSIVFTDDTYVSFTFEVVLDEEVELSDFKGGNLSNERKLIAMPVRLPVKPLEPQ